VEGWESRPILSRKGWRFNSVPGHHVFNSLTSAQNLNHVPKRSNNSCERRPEFVSLFSDFAASFAPQVHSQFSTKKGGAKNWSYTRANVGQALAPQTHEVLITVCGQ
jgi:hypothetical protein